MVAGFRYRAPRFDGANEGRVSPLSQGSSNNALLEVIAQLRQQNQVLLGRLASQQSVNGSVMAQARHTPATNSIASMVHPAADAAWKTKKAKSGPARDTSANVIIQDGWSAPVDIRGIQAGRHGYLSCHAKRGRRGDARVALRRWTCYSHDKADRSWVGRDRIRSQNISGPVNNVEALLGAAGRRSGHIQVFCAKRRSRGGRHFPCSDRFPQKLLPSRCVEDSHDPTEVSYRILAQEAWSGARGLLTTQIREGPMVSTCWPGFRKTTSRRFFAEAGSSVSSLAPSPSRIRPPGGSE